jgi:hypothetical protein
MSEHVDPLSEFTIALPTKTQSELVSKAAHVAFGRGQTFEVCLLALLIYQVLMGFSNSSRGRTPPGLRAGMQMELNVLGMSFAHYGDQSDI